MNVSDGTTDESGFMQVIHTPLSFIDIPFAFVDTPVAVIATPCSQAACFGDTHNLVSLSLSLSLSFSLLLLADPQADMSRTFQIVLMTSRAPCPLAGYAGRERVCHAAGRQLLAHPL